jgi:hypothetical protein
MVQMKRTVSGILAGLLLAPLAVRPDMAAHVAGGAADVLSGSLGKQILITSPHLTSIRFPGKGRAAAGSGRYAAV